MVSYFSLYCCFLATFSLLYPYPRALAQNVMFTALYYAVGNEPMTNNSNLPMNNSQRQPFFGNVRGVTFYGVRAVFAS